MSAFVSEFFPSASTAPFASLLHCARCSCERPSVLFLAQFFSQNVVLYTVSFFRPSSVRYSTACSSGSTPTGPSSSGVSGCESAISGPKERPLLDRLACCWLFMLCYAMLCYAVQPGLVSPRPRPRPQTSNTRERLAVEVLSPLLRLLSFVA